MSHVTFSRDETLSSQDGGRLVVESCRTGTRVHPRLVLGVAHIQILLSFVAQRPGTLHCSILKKKDPYLEVFAKCNFLFYASAAAVGTHSSGRQIHAN